MINLINRDMTGKEAETLLDEAHITVNKNSIPFDPQSFFKTSGVRIGTASVTTRGMVEQDMVIIAEVIDLVLTHKKIDEAAKIVVELTDKYPIYQ